MRLFWAVSKYVDDIGPRPRRLVQRATLIGPGLKGVRRTRELADTPSLRGIVNAIPHLMEIIKEWG